MNINKVLSHVAFDELLLLTEKMVPAVLESENLIKILIRENIKPDQALVTHRLFLYLINLGFKKNYDDHLYYQLIYNKHVITYDDIKKFELDHITPELNQYLLYSLTDNDYKYLSAVHSKLLTTFLHKNEVKVLTDKDFALKYVKYMRVNYMQLLALVNSYPDLIQLDINKIKNKDFVKTFYSNLLISSSNHLNANFINLYYKLFLSGLFEKNLVQKIMNSKAFFETLPVVQNSFRNFLKN